MVTNPYDLERAREQALRIRQYHHPNIIRCLDSFTESESRHILVLERCSDDLRGFINFCQGKKENQHVFIRFFTHIIEGLVEVHSRNQIY